MPYKRFILTREIIHGWGALKALKSVPATRAFIVTDKMMVQLGYPDRVEAILNEKGAECRRFDEVEPDPSLDTVKKCLAQVMEFKPDLIIGLGGGSPIDAGKTVWAFYEHPDLAEMEWDEMRRQLPRRSLRQKAKYVAIPTTSGTGSEVSFGAVISNHQVDPPDKRILFSFQFTPDVAIVDAELASSMPPDVTAATGYDALVHALEPFVGGPVSDIVDSLAVTSIKNILKWLPQAVADGSDVTAREKMHLAATMAMAAGTNGTGSLNHDLAHQLGSFYHIVHGIANAVTLDHFLVWLYKYNPEAQAMLAEELGMEVKSTRDGAQKLIKAMVELRQKVGLPGSIKEIGIDEGVFMSQLDRLIEYTLASGLSSQKPTPEEVKEIYLKAWEGAEPALPPE
ncbi:MAG: iron-containing alcohol dehydrogenase [Chloroflexi bacterium]|nr:iron-containing alcohol dehydrogenase [Chloroflexota bacterium]